MREWLREQKRNNPNWFRAVVGLTCLTALLQATTCGLSWLMFVYLSGVIIPSSGEEWRFLAEVSFGCALPWAAVLAGPVWAVVAVVGLVRWRRSRGSKGLEETERDGGRGR